MPSQKILEQKQQFVDALSQKMNEATAGVLVKYEGINVADDTKLRAEMRAAEIDYAVIKNNLIHLAAHKSDLAELDPFLKGTTALAMSSDTVAAAKILSKYADTSKTFEIKAGFVEGKVISAAEVNALAKLPAKEVLIAQVLGGLNAPISGFANVLNANIRGLVVALNAIAEQKTA